MSELGQQPTLLLGAGYAFLKEAAGEHLWGLDWPLFLLGPGLPHVPHPRPPHWGPWGRN